MDIEKLKKRCGYDGKPQQFKYGFDLACRELGKQPRWISVEDRLPNTGDPVLLLVCGKITQGYLFDDFEFDEYSMEQKSYQGFQNEFSDDCLEWADVTHWMPLPEPPAKECK